MLPILTITQEAIRIIHTTLTTRITLTITTTLTAPITTTIHIAALTLLHTNASASIKDSISSLGCLSSSLGWLVFSPGSVEQHDLLET